MVHVVNAYVLIATCDLKGSQKLFELLCFMLNASRGECLCAYSHT